MGNDRVEGTSSSDASGNPSAIVFSETHQLLHEAYPPSEKEIWECAVRGAIKSGAKIKISGPFVSKRASFGPRAKFGNKPLYLFFDEAGDFDLGEKGSKFFILTCAMTQRPFRCADDLSELKRDMLERGDDVEYFHACNDRKFIRAEVFEHIRLYEQFFAVYYAAVEKSVGDPEFSTPGDIYCNLFDTLFKSINRDFELDSASKIIAVTDKLPSDIKKKEYTQRLKAVLKRHAPGRFTIAHHRSMSSYNLQIADYYCWAIQRSREQGDNGHVLSLKAIRSGLEFWAPMKKQEPPGD